jgi:hypothetical protein
MKANKPNFDPACQELAEHFLPRDAETHEIRDLSQVIQTAIEGWLSEAAQENPASVVAQKEGCTCRWVGEGNDPDAHVRRDEWCPLHGRDPDAEREAMMDARQ